MLFKLMKDAADTGGKVISENKEFSYSLIYQQSLMVSRILRDGGIDKGGVVAVILGADANFISCVMGIVGCGAIAMPLNPRYQRAEMELLFKQSQVQLVVTSKAFAKKCKEVIKSLNLEVDTVIVDELFAKTKPNTDLENSKIIRQPQSNDDAIIFHSSGSTGRSKLIRRTHGQIMAEINGFAQAAKTSSQDVFFTAVPLYHAHGFSNCVLASLNVGANLVIFLDNVPAFFATDKMIDCIERYGVTIIPAVPMTFDLLSKTERNPDFTKLRLCITAGTGLPEDTFRTFLARFGIPLRQLYGCSEAGALTLNTSIDISKTWNSVGKPLIDVSFKITDPDNEGVGQIAVSSKSLTKGYDGQPDLNRQSFVDGYFLTGDQGRIDSDGLLYITGKRSFYIEIGGHKLDPYEIEDIIRSHPDIQDAAVIGADSSDRRQVVVKAVIVKESNSSISALEVQQHCAEQLAIYKVPEIVEFRDDLPRSPLGKVLKKYLK